MFVIRWILRQVISVIDHFMRPSFAAHPPARQRELDEKTQYLKVYQFKACPFCVKLRWALLRCGVNVEYLDAKNDPSHREALRRGGGKIQVPCLRIEKADGSYEWLYESNDIIAYIESAVLAKSA